MKQSRVRLYVDHPLGRGQTVPLAPAQAHYLFGVMRLGRGDVVALFNGRDGEFAGVVEAAGKRRGLLRCLERTRALMMPPDLWFIFAPIKKARTDFIVEKAAEMGAARIMPAKSEFTNSQRIRRERLQAHAVEAAEQCGGTYVPEVAEMVKLGRLLDDWPEERQLMFCDETLAGRATGLAGAAGAGNGAGANGAGNGAGADGADGARNRAAGAPWAILIGPEGGFSPAERSRLHAMKQAHPVSLGPRILRADTAAVAALTLWQSTLGDWP